MTTRRIKLATGIAAAAMGAAGFGLLATPAGAATSGSTTQGSLGGPATSTGKACDRAPWEAKVQGRPKAYQPGARSGDYIWHDSDGFHLRVTHGNNHDQRVYSGVITSSSPMRIDPVKLEKGDKVVLSSNHKTMLFEFANHGYIDGVNFHTDCARALYVSRLHIGSSNENPKLVYLGYYDQHPSKIPFSVHRYSKP